MGPPTKPPMTIPAIAAAIATDSAAATPAAANCGANANAVAGPPVSAAGPISTPNKGDSPKATAVTMPIKLWITAKNVASARNTSACRVPAFNKPTLALRPMDVKNAVINGACKVVSNFTEAILNSRDIVTRIAITSPPTTAAGML